MGAQASKSVKNLRYAVNVRLFVKIATHPLKTVAIIKIIW